jgi:uncharacterized protein (TIGR03437 family)
LSADLQEFNALLKVNPTWTPVPGGPPLLGGNLQGADGNSGPVIAGSGYLAAVQGQLQALQATGIQAVSVAVPFPILYGPFLTYGKNTLAPYAAFYQEVAQLVHASGLKLIVDNEILYSNGVDGNWGDVGGYYATLNWTEYQKARAAMAATIEQTMQPDYFILAEEPDTEATQANQPNLNIPADAVQMVEGEIAAVRDAVQRQNLPTPRLGAGFGSWIDNLPEYLSDYLPIPGLNYIDFHVLPINTENEVSFIGNSLLIAQTAAAAHKPVAIGQAWVWKMENGEWNTNNDEHDVFRARDPFSFWAPLDATFLRTMQALANYANMLYLVPEGPHYLFAYQTYGGTAPLPAGNGGAANCTCTTLSCSEYAIIRDENTLANTANSLAEYTTTGFSWYNQLVPAPDATSPSQPGTTLLSGQAVYTQANFSWSYSIDNVGVVGYNVYRCSPPAFGESCTGVRIANTTPSCGPTGGAVGASTTCTYSDSPLAENTPYNYQLQAFDLAGNNSALSPALHLQTLLVAADSPNYLAATAISPTAIDLSWSPPQDATGLTGYLVYRGTLASNLHQIAATGSNTTTYGDRQLQAGNVYWYAAVAVEGGKDSPRSPLASASTLPLPNPPDSVTATASSPTQIVLVWQENNPPGGLRVASYQIFEGATPGQLTQTGTSETTTYTARSLAAGTTYWFRIVAVDTGNDDSGPSNDVSARTPPLPPAAPVPAQTEANALFDDSQVQALNVTMNPSDWTSLLQNYRLDTYYPATAAWNGVSVTFGIRPAGGGSRNGIKPDLDFDFDHYTTGQTFVGLPSILLKANNSDPSNLHEWISMKLYRKMGLPAPREAPAQLFVNGSLLGFYYIVEPEDETFLERNFGEYGGHLYKWAGGDDYEFGNLGTNPYSYSRLLNPETDPPAPDPANFVNLIQAINAPASSEAAYIEGLSQYIDPKLFFTYCAAENLLADEDGVLGGLSGARNFYLYQFQNSTVYQMIAWDKDRTFSDPNRAIMDGVTTGPLINLLAQALYGFADYRNVYLSELTRAAALFGGAGGWADSEIAREFGVIENAAAHDPNKQCDYNGAGPLPCGTEDFEAGVEAMHVFMAQRPAVVLASALSAGYQPIIADPQIQNVAVLAPGYPPLQLSPGVLAGVTGTNLGPSQQDSAEPLARILGGTFVAVDGVRAPLLATGSGRIEFQMPGDEPVGVANVVVSVAGSMSNTQSVDTWPATPVLLAVERSNGTVVAAGNPAAAGEIVTVYALGLGAVTPGIVIGGAVSANALSTTVLTPQLELGAVPMNVLFSGLVPGFAGLYQINAQMPSPLPQGPTATLTVTDDGQVVTWPMAIE